MKLKLQIMFLFLLLGIGASAKFTLTIPVKDAISGKPILSKITFYERNADSTLVRIGSPRMGKDEITGLNETVYTIKPEYKKLTVRVQSVKKGTARV